MFRQLLSLLSPVQMARLTSLLDRLKGRDTASVLCWIGHRSMERLPHRPTAASRGALERWEWAHPLTRWDLMGVAPDSRSFADKWLER